MQCYLPLHSSTKIVPFTLESRMSVICGWSNVVVHLAVLRYQVPLFGYQVENLRLQPVVFEGLDPQFWGALLRVGLRVARID